MVFIHPSEAPTCLTAYLVTSLTQRQLDEVKAAFEVGACSRFNPLLELKIVRAPEDYVGKSHQYMRAQENAAGRTDAFVVIDSDAVKRGAVWYVDAFADEEMVDDGIAKSTDVVMKILVKTDCLALTWVNYSIANMSIDEDLDNAGVEAPVNNDFFQPEISDCGGLDMEEQQGDQDVLVTVEPGEWEETTNESILDNFMPRPRSVAKLTAESAAEAGLVSDWALFDKAEPIEMGDGTTKRFPDGSIQFQQKYDPDFAWPDYQWPEGSL